MIELTDEKTIGLFYAVSSMVVEFMVDTYGLDKIHALLTESIKIPALWPRVRLCRDGAGESNEAAPGD